MFPELPRRAWLQLLGALAAAPTAVSQQASQTRRRVSKETLDDALQLIGLDFTDAQKTMALAGINRHLAQYEALRKVSIPLDTDPPFYFNPLPRGRALARGAGQFEPRRLAAPKRRHWESVDDLAFLPVTELAPLVRARQVTSTELTKMYLARLKRYGPKLNCIVTLTEDLALEQAAQADGEIRRGRYRGPLHGIPWGAKDLFATKGIPTTWGAEPYRNQVLDYDATVVGKLAEAGAVLVAKLSMGALAQGGLWFGGMTRNPWDTEQSSSGSSAGPAAATAAGLVGFSIGTETLGSIISPSTRCGCAGLRPTFGRVSRYGAMALCWTMDKIGPICRSVEDCALALHAIHGSDGRDLAAVDVPLDWNPRQPLERLRIGVLQKEFDRAKDDQKAVYTQALADLQKAGAQLAPAELPDFPAQPLMLVLQAEAAAAFDDLTRDGGVNQLSGQTPGDWPNSFRTARLIPAVEYIRAQRARTLLIDAMDRLMQQWDVLAGPGGAGLMISNMTGHPQVVVPCGFIKGMPQGISFTGRLYEEGAPLRVALAYEQATRWHTMHPKVDWA